MHKFLKILQWFYLGLTSIDRFFFRFLPFLVFKPRAKVISIGNLSMGGTGKTPVLFELLNEILKLNAVKKVCVVSRGYKSAYENSFFDLHGPGPHPEKLTDEALLFNQKFPDVPLLLGKRRDRSARYAEKRLAPDLLLLDDGFQYRRLQKDCEILLWDSHTLPHEAELIPLGRLREPVSRLREAHVILLTRCESAPAAQINYWEKWLAEKAPGKKVVKMQTVCEGLFDYCGRRINNRPCEAVVFSAIGRPAGFYLQLQQLGIKVVHKNEFRDHHYFSPDELEKLTALHRQSGLPVICTEKDRVKVSAKMAGELGLLTLVIRMIPLSRRSLLEEIGEELKASIK